MELLLPFNIQPSSKKVSYKDAILFIGSCFSEEIGKKLIDLKFNVVQNPNGILYNPVSICDAILSYIDNKKFTEDDLIHMNGLWHSWKHHSLFSRTDKAIVLANINQSQANAHKHLKDVSWLIVTPGTSYTYFLKEPFQPVANCHKAPSDLFEKKLLTSEKIIDTFSKTISKIQSFIPEIKIMFTISPVRHVKDGLVENNVSKARLIEAIHLVKNNFKNVFYFPAYELVIDVLRDYRFYKNDLTHPSETAVDFVFEKFCATFMDDSSLLLMKEITAIVSAMKHKPFFKETIQYKNFKQAQLEKIRAINLKNPSLDFSLERNYFS